MQLKLIRYKVIQQKSFTTEKQDLDIIAAYYAASSILVEANE